MFSIAVDLHIFQKHENVEYISIVQDVNWNYVYLNTLFDDDDGVIEMEGSIPLKLLSVPYYPARQK